MNEVNKHLMCEPKRCCFHFVTLSHSSCWWYSVRDPLIISHLLLYAYNDVYRYGRKPLSVRHLHWSIKWFNTILISTMQIVASSQKLSTTSNFVRRLYINHANFVLNSMFTEFSTNMYLLITINMLMMNSMPFRWYRWNFPHFWIASQLIFIHNKYERSIQQSLFVGNFMVKKKNS